MNHTDWLDDPAYYLADRCDVSALAENCVRLTNAGYDLSFFESNAPDAFRYIFCGASFFRWQRQYWNTLKVAPRDLDLRLVSHSKVGLGRFWHLKNACLLVENIADLDRRASQLLEVWENHRGLPARLASIDTEARSALAGRQLELDDLARSVAQQLAETSEQTQQEIESLRSDHEAEIARLRSHRDELRIRIEGERQSAESAKAGTDEISAMLKSLG